jgi:hypothetical protein
MRIDVYCLHGGGAMVAATNHHTPQQHPTNTPTQPSTCSYSYLGEQYKTAPPDHLNAGIDCDPESERLARENLKERTLQAN